MTRDELKAKLDTFSPVKVEFVSKVVESLSSPPRSTIRTTGTWLTQAGDWIEYFGLALSVHHGATTEPLGLTSFETVFRNACRYMNWSVEPPGSATQRFVDLTIRANDGTVRRLSLKSTAARNLSQSAVHISKLTEAAWIQDTRTPRDRRQKTRDLFGSYQQAVSSIIMLRAFREKAGEAPKLYQLVEIPVSIFDSIQQAPLKDFERDAPVIACRVGNEIVARVAIDRSDAKITVRGVQLAACTVHAEWRRS